MAVGDGEITLLRDAIQRLETSLRDHVLEVRENRNQIRDEIAGIRSELNNLNLLKGKVLGVVGFIAFLASFILDWAKTLLRH